MKTNKRERKKVTIVWARTVLEARLLRVANTLSEDGYSVNVFAWDREARKPDIEGHEKFKCHYLHMKSPYDSPVTFLLLPLWWFLSFIFLIRNRPKAVHACDMDCFVPALLYSKITGSSLIYDIFDIYGSMVEASVPSFASRLLKSVEGWCAQKSDAVIMVNTFQYKELMEPDIQRKLFLVNSPHEVDIREVRKRGRALKTSLPEKKKRSTLIFFAGSLQYKRRFDQMIKAIKGLDGVHHIVAGAGADADRLIPMFQGSENTDYIGPISFDDVLAWSSVADIIYVLFDNSVKKYRWGAQTRLFIGMMLGTPVLVTDDSNPARIIKEAGAGFAVKDGDIKGLRKAVKKLVSSPATRKKMGESGMAEYNKKYAWGEMKYELLDLYSELMGDK